MNDSPFAESTIPGEKIFHGVALPKTLSPVSPAVSGADALVQGVTKNSSLLSSLLRKHGAILFRGFDVSGASDLRRVVEAFEWEEMPYLGGSPRLKIDERVYTSNEAPLDLFIRFHHEMSLMKEIPSKIFFFCLTPPREGGETALARSDVLFREMVRRVPEFVNRVAEVGTVVELEYPKENTTDLIMGTSWKSVLETDDPSLAKQRALEKMECSSFEITKDGHAEVLFGPLQVIRTLDGQTLWFNNIDGSDVKLGDGNPVPHEAIDAYRETLGEISVDIEWQKGDVLLVDNWSVQHARRPGKPPRQILVSLCK
ncbi:clavaminate synthase-like protein At3g21360 [Aristolochia californica]|uniref:clavaminate synthase-like protein At3g21360 n=1 Tax=Aristolochia californica TaxID=171875 RepID=UPI0035D8C5CD